ncbi:platelet endothelial aggregation receptor 1 [Biomphalaria pfeifferi]|uniref:Platelet endothelial aggregation receptor 1 n=1 Tax=Biomphalaria pfeifferi TaxID=112525 RepID=A0AAD8B1D3_BIOPF|nr:platelet endothelial aggregation receptor 1 [Biomphalaria pfeifferi]
MITSLTLSGNLSSLCSFYISRGRKIAYGQHASQSSDWSLYRVDFRADVASNYIIKRFTIYNRGDGNGERLQGFVINTYDENSARIGYYEDRSGLRNVLIYFINLNGNVNDTVNFISIRFNGNRKILTLCEVEVYGECPSGQWSLQCGKLCPASCPNNCDRDTGACNTVCNGYSNPPQCDTEWNRKKRRQAKEVYLRME